LTQKKLGLGRGAEGKKGSAREKSGGTEKKPFGKGEGFMPDRIRKKLIRQKGGGALCL